MEWLAENKALVLEVFVAVHALALAIVNLTPTPKDNEVLGKVYKWIEVLGGVVTRKAKEAPK